MILRYPRSENTFRVLKEMPKEIKSLGIARQGISGRTITKTTTIRTGQGTFRPTLTLNTKLLHSQISLSLHS